MFRVLQWLYLCLLCLPVGALEAEQPIGGWQLTSTDTANFMQNVNYPAVRVNTGGKSRQALISGDILLHPKGDHLPLLIINGNPMALPLNGSHYARPYAFGKGSNNIEVRDDLGHTLRRTQFYESNPQQIAPGIRIILTWNTDHTDLDLHVITPQGEHVWYGQRVASTGDALDIDVTDGYGPEIFSSLTPVAGTYLVYANYYGGQSTNDLTEATVTIMQHENTLKEKRQTFILPMRRPGELAFVGSFIYQP